MQSWGSSRGEWLLAVFANALLTFRRRPASFFSSLSASPGWFTSPLCFPTSPLGIAHQPSTTPHRRAIPFPAGSIHPTPLTA